MHYFTSKDHRLDLYYDINYYQPMISEIENEAESISKGVSYMVNDFTSADSMAMASRMDNQLYMEALQKLSYRIRTCAGKINEITKVLACSVLDPSAQTQITWNEINHQISDLIHSLEVSYNNLRWIYLYIKGEVHIPESHVMPLLVIPYMDFTEDELPEDKIDSTNEESPEEDNTDLKGLNGDFDGDQVTAEGIFSQEANEEEPDDSVESEENPKDAVKLEYKKISFPVDKKIMNEVESLYPKHANDSSEVKTDFNKGDIEKIITDRMKEIKEKGEFEVMSDDSSDKDEKIDRNTWIIGGVVVEMDDLPVKTDDPKETWIVWPNYVTELDHNFEFVRYDQEAQKWVNVQSDENIGLTNDDVALYVYASKEAGCFGKVSKFEYLPKYGMIHSVIYCEENNTYYKYDFNTPEASKDNPKPKHEFGWFAMSTENSSSDVAPIT